MTEEEKAPSISVKDVPDPITELRNILKEQQAVIVKQNEALKSLTARLNEQEKLISASPSSVTKEKEPAQEDAQDIAYKSMLAELGIKDIKEE